MFSNPWIQLLLFPLIGYLFGSLTFALWVTKVVQGVDVRDAGSRHATTTNTIRQAGWGPGVLVFVLDVAKGFVPVYLALRGGAAEWVVGLTAAAAVAGHCWPLFAGFRGGMGLATAGGGFLAVSPLSFVVLVGVLVALTLVMRHSARASVVAGVLAAPVLWLLGMRGVVIWIGALAGAVIAARFTVDWNRQYRELWLDRG